jgi:hypothetical protein
MSVPVMRGWMAQKNGYEPVSVGAVKDPLAPAGMVSVLKLPSSAVAVCGAESLFTTVTVAPGATRIAENWKPLISSVAPAAFVADPPSEPVAELPPEVAAAGGAAVEAGCGSRVSAPTAIPAPATHVRSVAVIPKRIGVPIQLSNGKAEVHTPGNPTLVKNQSDDVSHRATSSVNSEPPMTGRAHPGSRSMRSASSLVVNTP